MRSMIRGTPVLGFPKPDWSKSGKGRPNNSSSWYGRTKAFLEEKKGELENRFFQEEQEAEDEEGKEVTPPTAYFEPPRPNKPRPRNKPRPEPDDDADSRSESISRPAPEPQPAPSPDSPAVPSQQSRPEPATTQPESPPVNPTPVTSEEPPVDTGEVDSDNNSGRNRLPVLPRRSSGT